MINDNDADQETSTNEMSEEKLSAIAERWIKKINKVKDSNEHKSFVTTGQKIVKIYKNSSALLQSLAETAHSRIMFNILWSNVQILAPTLFSRLPKIVVQRRFKDADPVARVASLTAERATSYMMLCKQDEFYHAVKSAVLDSLLPGRGTTWVRYEAEFGQAEDSGEEQISPYSEKVCLDYVFWEDYFESRSRNPYEVDWKARRLYLSYEEMKRRFGEEIAKDCKESVDEEEQRDYSDADDENTPSGYEIFEIWCKASKKVYWIALNYSTRPLDIREDPLKLDGFFPSPIPLVATTTNESTYPTPDYRIYEKLASELDYATKRIHAMVDTIRLVGATAAQFNQDIKSMLSLTDGQLWPIENWSNFVEKGALRGSIDWLPFDQAVNALPALINYKQMLLSDIHEVTGIPDIARGVSDPSETAAAQQQKSRWTSVKISQRQEAVQRFCREIASSFCQIIFEPGLFSDETIALIAGVQQMTPDDQQLFPQALQLLRDDKLRTFRIDIETDSTIAMDESIEQEARMRYVEIVNQLVASSTQARPEMMSAALESAMFAVRAFRSGKAVEGSWQRAIDLFEQQQKEAAQNPQQPPPDPAIIQAQAYAQDIQAKNELKQLEMQNHIQELQGQQQIDMQKLQFQAQELQQKATEAQMRYDVDMQRLQLESQKAMSKAQLDEMSQQLDQWKTQFMAEVEKRYADIEQYKVVLSEKEKLIEEARLQQQRIVDQVSLMADKAPPSAPTVNIVNASGPREVVLRRTPDGSLVGLTKEVG